MIDDANDHDRGLLAPGTVVGNYRVDRLIAEGGMGSVYEALHRVLPRRAAVKVLHRNLLGKPGARERFFQEAGILELLDDVGLGRIHDAGVTDENRPYLAMELLDGVTLAQTIAVHGTLVPVEVVEILGQLAASLEKAHAIGIVHRDLKPENVILHRGDDALEVRVIDWGIARVCDPRSTRITSANTTPGTPLYMSPEQARGKAVDGRSDVYALGLIAFEALVGKPPFDGETAMDIVMRHLTEEPPALRALRPEVPEELAHLVGWMLAKEPDERPTLATARELLAELAAELRGASAYEDVEISMEVELDDDLTDEPALPRPRWTPLRTIVPSDERRAVAGEIITSRMRQLGKASLAGLVITTLLTAIMLAFALALPAIGLRTRSAPTAAPVIQHDPTPESAGEPGSAVLVNIR